MRRRLVALTVVGASATVLASIGPGAGAAPRTASTVGAVGATGFGTPVVVDNFRPGYEPNVAVDTVKSSAYDGSTYVSVPNGFSTTQSFLWRSDDDRQSFHLTEGNALGKSTTCVGGGDTELKIDPLNGTVYFADLQGLTNFSNSTSTDGGHTFNTTCTAVNGAGVDRQWEGIDTNGGTAAVGTGATAGRIYFDYDNVDQDLAGSGNQLVMNASVDGVHFGADCTGVTVGTTPVGACAAPPAQISGDEGIPGNIVVDNIPGDAHQHRVYAIHTSGDSSSVIVSWCSGKPGDATAATVAADCTDPTALAATQPSPTSRVNEYWHDTAVRVPGPYLVGHLFPSIAIDPAGNLYAVWSEYPTGDKGAGVIKMAISRDGAQTWSAPIAISQASNDEAVMPWVTTGDTGRVGVAWYGTNDTVDGATGPDSAVNAEWNLYYASTADALAATPSYTTSQVNEPGHYVKYGTISTGGLGGAEDRSLGDFFQVQTGAQGQAVITYVDDTSDNRNTDFSGGTGETPAEAAGPTMVATQDSGPGLYAAQTVPTGGSNLDGVTVSAAQAAKDAFYSSAGIDVAAAANQQVVGTSVAQADATHLTVTMTTADPNLAADLLASPTLGGTTADWLVRWAAPDYDKPGDGNIWYVGMESNAGGAPSFYTGTSQAITTTHTKYFVYPRTTAIPGTISGSTITWTVPLSAVGSPSTGQGLYSVTGFTVTQTAPSPATTVAAGTGGQVGDLNIPNLIGVAPPFDFYVGDVSPGTPLPEAVLPIGLLVIGTAIGGVAYARRRRYSAV